MSSTEPRSPVRRLLSAARRWWVRNPEAVLALAELLQEVLRTVYGA